METSEILEGMSRKLEGAKFEPFGQAGLGAYSSGKQLVQFAEHANQAPGIWITVGLISQSEENSVPIGSFWLEPTPLKEEVILSKRWWPKKDPSTLEIELFRGPLDKAINNLWEFVENG